MSATISIPGQNNKTFIILDSSNASINPNNFTRKAGGCGAIWIEETFTTPSESHAKALCEFIVENMAIPQKDSSPYESFMLSYKDNLAWCVRKIPGPNALVGLTENARSAVYQFSDPSAGDMLAPFELEGLICTVRVDAADLEAAKKIYQSDTYPTFIPEQGPSTLNAIATAMNGGNKAQEFVAVVGGYDLCV